MKKEKHANAHLKGIFVQRNLEYKNSSKRRRDPFCVTFPRLENLGQGDSRGNVLFPSDDFKTFNLAHKFAIQTKKIDSRLKKCPIFLCDYRWTGSSARREIQQIG